MLNKIKLILWLIILLAVAYFVSMNTQPSVSVNLLPTYKTPEIPLALIIIISLILGAVLILIFTITDWIAFKIEKLKLKKQINSLEKNIKKCKEEKNKIIEENKKLKEEIELLKAKGNISVKEVTEEVKKDGTL
ncbi:lipopolysaccharide assembly protein LapA domain-containing protein [Persephonella sp.]